MSAEDKNHERYQLFKAKKKYLFGFIEDGFRIIKKNKKVEEFVTKFISKFIENCKMKADNDADEKEIANFIDWLDKKGFYPQDKSYIVILGDEIYPWFICKNIVKDLDIFFDINLDKYEIKLKDEGFRSTIFNVLKNQKYKIDRNMLFKNFYERVMKDEKMNPEKK